jgi:predicted RNase H-like HicB family nuclease
MKQKVLEYNTIFQKEDEGGFSVWVPSLPGCTSQGETFEEAMGNIKEAITLYLKDESEQEKQDEMLEVRNQFMVPVSITT